MKLPTIPAHARPAGPPAYGKRTRRAPLMIAPRTEQLVKEIADRLEANESAVRHAIIATAVHENFSHTETVVKVFLGRNK